MEHAFGVADQLAVAHARVGQVARGLRREDALYCARRGEVCVVLCTVRTVTGRTESSASHPCPPVATTGYLCLEFVVLYVLSRYRSRGMDFRTSRVGGRGGSDGRCMRYSRVHASGAAREITPMLCFLY